MKGFRVLQIDQMGQSGGTLLIFSAMQNTGCHGDVRGQESDIQTDRHIFNLYGLTPEEREAIGFIDFHSRVI